MGDLHPGRRARRARRVLQIGDVVGIAGGAGELEPSVAGTASTAINRGRSFGTSVRMNVRTDSAAAVVVKTAAGRASASTAANRSACPDNVGAKSGIATLPAWTAAEETRHIVEALWRQDRHPIPGLGDLLQTGADRADPRPQLVPAELDGPPVLVLRVVDEAVRRAVTVLGSVAIEIRRQRHALGHHDPAAADSVSARIARGGRDKLFNQ